MIFFYIKVSLRLYGYCYGNHKMICKIIISEFISYALALEDPISVCDMCNHIINHWKLKCDIDLYDHKLKDNWT